MACGPLAEIAVDAMLRSREPQVFNEKSVSEWLGKSPGFAYSFQAITESGRHIVDGLPAVCSQPILAPLHKQYSSRMSDNLFLVRNHMNELAKGRTQGNFGCVCAASDYTFKNRFKEHRQAYVNTLVEEYLTKVDSKLKEAVGYTEEEARLLNLRNEDRTALNKSIQREKERIFKKLSAGLGGTTGNVLKQYKASKMKG
ncbi:MAG: hypothetical protein Q9195_009421 [Heterodermia aff. obscurata]